MIDRSHDLPIAVQARELGISRGSVYYEPRPDLSAARERLALGLRLAGLARDPRRA